MSSVLPQAGSLLLPSCHRVCARLLLPSSALSGPPGSLDVLRERSLHPTQKQRLPWASGRGQREEGPAWPAWPHLCSTMGLSLRPPAFLSLAHFRGPPLWATAAP